MNGYTVIFKHFCKGDKFLFDSQGEVTLLKRSFFSRERVFFHKKEYICYYDKSYTEGAGDKKKRKRTEFLPLKVYPFTTGYVTLIITIQMILSSRLV